LIELMKKRSSLSVKLAKKVTILDVEEIPTDSVQGKIIQLKKELSTVQEDYKNGR
jgi:hypothetical protein